jgi:hypothetical protein
LDKIIGLIRKEIEQFQPDISTEKGRKAIASLARKVASSKSRLEEYGKNLSAKIKVQAVGIDAERRRMKEELDALRDQARKPLTDYEEAVAARVEAHEQSLREVIDLANVPFGASVLEIEQRVAKLDALTLRSWEEFTDRFQLSYSGVSSRLAQILAETQRQAEVQAAFAKSEAERHAREAKESQERMAKEQSERDERIAREAAAKAERESLERERAAEARAVKAEQDAKDAVTAEQKRAAMAKAAAEDEARRREADKAHKSQIDNSAIAALVAAGISNAAANKAIDAIARGIVPNVRITY